MSPVIRDGNNRLSTYDMAEQPAEGSGPVMRLVEPSMVRVPDVTGKTNAEYMAASRSRGAKAGGFVKGATKPARRWNGDGPRPPAEGPGSRPDQVGKKRSPEARANMAAAQRAIWERKRAAKAAALTTEPKDQEAGAPVTDAATVDPGPPPAAVETMPPGPPEPFPGSFAAAAAMDRALGVDIGGGSVEGEDRCSFGRFLGSLVIVACDRPAGHGGAHRGRLIRVGIVAETFTVLGHAAVPA